MSDSESKTDWEQSPTTGTPFSKYLAMVLFVVLPFVGFWLGVEYGKSSKAIHVDEQDSGVATLRAFEAPSQETPIKNFEYVKEVDKTPVPRSPARAYLAADLNSGHIFTSKNIDEQLPIASITKLMTAVVIMEQMDMGQTVVVSTSSLVYTSKSRLVADEEVQVIELIYLLLTESSNEAALTLSHNFGSTTFVQQMNTKAKALGMKNTYFVDPSGSGAGNVSSINDLVVLAKYIVEYKKQIFDITASKFNDNSLGGELDTKSLENYNFFSYDASFVGGKSGKTTAAKETMLAVFETKIDSEQRQIIYIVLGSGDVEADVRSLRTHASTL